LKIAGSALETASGHQALNVTAAFRADYLIFTEDQLFEIVFTFAATVLVYGHIRCSSRYLSIV